MHLVERNLTLLHANNKGAVQPAHPHNVFSSLDGVIATKKTKSAIIVSIVRVSTIEQDVLADLICAKTVC